jgi:hypothetical protein
MAGSRGACIRAGGKGMRVSRYKERHGRALVQTAPAFFRSLTTRDRTKSITIVCCHFVVGRIPSNFVQSLLVSRGDFSCGMTRGRRTRGEPEALAPLLSRGSYPADNPERPRHFTATTPRPPKPSTSRPSPPLLLDTSSPPRLPLPSSTSSSTLDFAFASVRAPTRDL